MGAKGKGGLTKRYGYSWTTQLLGSDGKFNLGGYKWSNASHEYDESSYFYDGAGYVSANDYFVIIFMVGNIEYNVCIEQPKGAYFGPSFSLTAGGEALDVIQTELDGSDVYKMMIPADAVCVYLPDFSSYELTDEVNCDYVEVGSDGRIDLASIAFDRTNNNEFDSILSSGNSTMYVMSAMDSNWDYFYVVFEVAGAEEPAGPSLSLGADAADLKVGQEFTVDVSMENITAAAQAELTWSENLLLVKVEAGSALSGEDMVLENVEGNGLFSFVANEGEADGVVAVATFKCIAPGEAAVGLTEGLAGKTIDSDEYKIADPEALALSIGLAGIMGDVNHNAKINIVDAQIAYDLACGKYAAGSDAAAALLACWGNGATLPMVEAIADVNGEGLDATDAFAIQRFVHTGSWS